MDTVATFGFPIKPLRNRSRTWIVDRVPVNVERCFHAMALDEVRATFELVSVGTETRYDDDGQVIPDHRVYSVWFRGVHSNIGGGYVDRGLSDITLAWMMEQAVWAWGRRGRRPPPRFVEALTMLDPDAEDRPPPDWRDTSLETLEPDPNGRLGRPVDFRRGGARRLGDVPLVHHTVELRDRNLLSDHYSTRNKQLLRRVPLNVQYVYDPPVHFGGRRKDVLEALALSAFIRVPVNPRGWLKVGDDHVYRSDDWIGFGPEGSRNRSRLRKGRVSKGEFISITKEWVRQGRPHDPELLDVDLPDELGRPPTPAADVKRWVVAALAALDPHLPWTAEIDRLGPPGA